MSDGSRVSRLTRDTEVSATRLQGSVFPQAVSIVTSPSTLDSLCLGLIICVSIYTIPGLVTFCSCCDTNIYGCLHSLFPTGTIRRTSEFCEFHPRLFFFFTKLHPVTAIESLLTFIAEYDLVLFLIFLPLVFFSQYSITLSYHSILSPLDVF